MNLCLTAGSVDGRRSRRAATASLISPAARPRDVPTFDRAAGRAPRAVLFDMDDTIFDHTRTCEIALTSLWKEVPELSRRPLPAILAQYAELLNTVYSPLASDLKEHDRSRAERFRRLFEFAGTPISIETATRHSDEYRSRYQAARVEVPGAGDLLTELHGRVTVGIVSNNHQDEQLDKLRALGLEDRIDFVVTSQLVGAAKPDPRIFQQALLAARCSAEEAVMVGDTWSTDIVGARSVGMPAVWFDRYGRPRPSDVPDVRVLRSYRPLDATVRLMLEGPSAPLA